MAVSTKRKYTGVPEDKVFQHKHCVTCNKMVPEFGDGYCSNECRNFGKRRDKMDKKKIFSYIGSIGVVVVMVIVLIFVLPMS